MLKNFAGSKMDHKIVASFCTILESFVSDIKENVKVVTERALAELMDPNEKRF